MSDAQFDDIIPRPIPVGKITMDGVQRLILGFVVVLIVIVSVLLMLVGSLLNNQKAGEIRGYKNRAIACMDIVNDHEITLTRECTDPVVVVYYPPDICAKIPDVPHCGDNAEVVVEV